MKGKSVSGQLEPFPGGGFRIAEKAKNFGEALGEAEIHVEGSAGYT